ncbi:MAG: SDR family oxidoreductase [Candidatus Cloacimonetes bacterium]|nr:SDR family oxidoreductase [Candidatus Cloacimonadota bacterium]
MDLQIKGKIALVTAASSGLGFAVARQLADEGVLLAICSRDRDRISAAASRIATASRGTVIPYVCDVTKDSDVEMMLEKIAVDIGYPDILVSNAGGPPAGKALDFQLEDYRQAVELNLLSTVRLCRGVLPSMQAKRWGRIVTITSVSVKQPLDNLILSNTARSGVTAYLKTLSNQVAAYGITVNAVCPGYTRTDRVEELSRAYADQGKGASSEFFAALEKDIPMKRLGKPEELAKTVAFLVSEGAAYITGVSLQVDGGYIKGLF